MTRQSSGHPAILLPDTDPDAFLSHDPEHPGGAQVASANARIPVALSIAGVDPSGGAGVLADLKAFSALGVYGCGVVAALTAQNTCAVSGFVAVDPAFVRAQIDTLFADVRVDAIKIGMLASAPVVGAVADALLATPGRSQPASRHLVLDPVMVAKSGDQLLSRAAVAALLERLVPLATVITPNLPEAGVLLNRRPPDNLAEMRQAAERLRRTMADRGERWVLLKGGHLSGDPVDLLHDGDRMIELPQKRVETRNTHGTGCTLSSALAALLGHRPEQVQAAAEQATAWLHRAILAADKLSVGRPEGHGPVHHFHALWRH